jgi:hypothetical protein
MKMLQKNPKSLRSIGAIEPSENFDYKTIQETKQRTESISPYEDLIYSRIEHGLKKKQRFIAFILHGLEGNPFDMRHIRAALLDCIPLCSIYIINNNYKLTNQDINIQAKRLSLEVKEILTFMNYFGKL